MAGVDVDLDAHPGAQGRQILIARIDPYPHRNALDNLHPIAAGILSGQKRELLRSRRTHALHGAFETFEATSRIDDVKRSQRTVPVDGSERTGVRRKPSFDYERGVRLTALSGLPIFIANCASRHKMIIAQPQPPPRWLV
jgi:hypothetical protein